MFDVVLSSTVLISQQPELFIDSSNHMAISTPKPCEDTGEDMSLYIGAGKREYLSILTNRLQLFHK